MRPCFSSVLCLPYTYTPRAIPSVGDAEKESSVAGQTAAEAVDGTPGVKKVKGGGGGRMKFKGVQNEIE